MDDRKFQDIYFGEDEHLKTGPLTAFTNLVDSICSPQGKRTSSNDGLHESCRSMPAVNVTSSLLIFSCISDHSFRSSGTSEGWRSDHNDPSNS